MHDYHLLFVWLSEDGVAELKPVHLVHHCEFKIRYTVLKCCLYLRNSARPVDWAIDRCVLPLQAYWREAVIPTNTDTPSRIRLGNPY